MAELRTISKLDKSAIMTIRLSRGFRIRTWIACRLVVLAGRVLGCSVNVDEENDDG